MKVLIFKKIVLVGLVFSIVDFCQIYAAEESKSIIISEDYDRDSAALQETYFNYNDITRIWRKKDDLKYLDELITGVLDLNKEDPEDLINAIMLADYLSIRDRSLLKPILLKIQEQITLPVAIKFKDIGVPIANFGIGQYQVEKALLNATHIKKIKKVVWSPNSSKYAVKYLDGSLQVYNSDRQPIGTPLYRTNHIVFSPNELECVVFYSNLEVQRYRLNGLSMLPIKKTLSNYIDIVFSPDGSKYAWFQNRGRIQLYNYPDRKRIGTPLDDVDSIVFSPDSSECAVIHSNREMQRYRLDGLSTLPIGTPLDDVDSIVFSPDSSECAVINYYGQTEFYNSAGQLIITPLSDRIGKKNIVFSPDGSKYAVISYYGSKMQLYRLDGLSTLPIGKPTDNVKSIVFSTDGSKYAVTHSADFLIPGDSFVLATRIKLYDSSDGQPIESHFNIRGFSPDFSQYWVELNDGRSAIIPKSTLMLDPSSLNSSIKLGEYLLFIAILNKYMITKKPVFLKAALLETLSYEVTSKLLENKIITFVPIEPHKLAYLTFGASDNLNQLFKLKQAL